jgi:hypothetical protein
VERVEEQEQMAAAAVLVVIRHLPLQDQQKQHTRLPLVAAAGIYQTAQTQAFPALD